MSQGGQTTKGRRTGRRVIVVALWMVCGTAAWAALTPNMMCKERAPTREIEVSKLRDLKQSEQTYDNRP